MTATRLAHDDHPSPGRGAVNPWVLIAGLAAGPFGWIVQLLVDYSLSGRLCVLGRGGAGPAPGAGAATVLVSINVVCLIIAVSGLALSWWSWRKVQSEKPGDSHQALDDGEGRSRFLALAGMMAAGAFAIAILFNTVEPLMIPACWNPAS